MGQRIPVVSCSRETGKERGIAACTRRCLSQTAAPKLPPRGLDTRPRRMMSKPLFTPGFCIPTSSLIDGRLLTGGVLFGAGWGLAGMCPGPAIVAALTGDPHVLAYLGSMAGGMWLEHRLTAWQQQQAKKEQQLTQQAAQQKAMGTEAVVSAPAAASEVMEGLSSAQPVTGGASIPRLKRVESQMG